MNAHPPFDIGTVEAIAKVLGEAGTGSVCQGTETGVNIYDKS